MTTHDSLSAVRSAYDNAADNYNTLLPDTRHDVDTDLNLITEFSQKATIATSTVLDAGCGTGRMSRHLTRLGCHVHGIDLSFNMVAIAQKNCPRMSFIVGDIASLPYANNHFGGVFAWYSIIHSTTRQLPHIFEEFRRVVIPGGIVMLAFQAGTGTRHIARAYGHDFNLDAELHQPDNIETLLTGVGLTVTKRFIREPHHLERHDQAILLARRDF